MKKFIACLLLGALLGMISPLLPAQQNQNTQKSSPEIEALKKRVSELEKQPQTVENVEKMESQTKLADEEFGKFEGRLRNSNNKWLREWSYWFLGVIGFFVVVSGVVISAVGGIFWFWLRSTANKLIADTVEKNLNGFKKGLKELAILKKQQEVLKKEADTLEKSFKDATAQLDILKNQQRILEKEHAAAMLESIAYSSSHERRPPYPERIKALSEEALLRVLDDEIYGQAIRYLAADVLADRKSPRLPSFLLEFSNSALDWEKGRLETHTFNPLTSIYFLGKIQTHEAYQGLQKFLNRLLTENPKK